MLLFVFCLLWGHAEAAQGSHWGASSFAVPHTTPEDHEDRGPGLGDPPLLEHPGV